MGTTPHGAAPRARLPFRLMTTFWGAHTDQLRGQSTASSTAAVTLSETVTTALELSRQVSWTGPDADEFHSRCDEVRRQLEDVLEDLRRRADELVDHAEAQDAASDSGSDSPLGPLGDLIGDLFSGGDRGLSPEDFWGPIKAPLGPIRNLVDGLGPSFPPRFDTEGIWGPFQAPAGPVREWIEDRFFDPDRYDVVDRVVNWGQKVGGDLWEWSMEQADEMKSSKLFRFGKRAIPAIPDLIEVGYHVGQGDTDMAYMTMLRASAEMLPGVTWVDLGLAEISDQLGDEHKVFDSDIRWNEGTPLEVLTKYGAQKSDEVGLMKPGEQYGEKWADALGVDNGIVRNAMSSYAGIQMYHLMNSRPVTFAEAISPFPVRQKIWEGLNSPFN